MKRSARESEEADLSSSCDPGWVNAFAREQLRIQTQIP